MARVLLAEARTRLALQSRSLDQIQSAITDINTAKGWLRSGIAVLSISAWAHAAAAHIASEKGRSDLVPAYLAVAEADGQRLHGYRPNPYAEKYRKLQLALFAEMDVTELPPKKVLPP